MCSAGRHTNQAKTPVPRRLNISNTKDVMSKKDYELIAAAVQRAACVNLHADTATTDALAKDLADALKRDNVRFDKGRFLAACGVPA